MSARGVVSFRLKRPEEIEKMRVSGRILGACLSQLAASVRAAGIEVHLIGDALAPRTAEEAVFERR